MSSRQLRKLRQYQELQLQKGASPDDKPAEDDDNEEDVDLVERARPKASLFAALGDQDDDDDDDDNADADVDVDDEERQQQHTEDDVPQPSTATTTTATASKNKKKKKPKKKGGSATADPTTTAVQVGPADDAEDEIDKAVKALNIKAAATTTTTTTTTTTATTPDNPLDRPLSINASYLRPSNEMISMFGRGVVETAQAQEQAERAAALRERMRNGAQTEEVDIETFLRGDPREKLPEVSLKRNVFVLGREHWPRATTGGLTMKMVGPMKDGTGTEYAFAHDVTYEGVQGAFFHYVLMGDPMRIIRLVKVQPYHVSSLLQASNICKQNQDTTFAAELCERALFTFGRVTTSAFRRDLETGTARLDFHRPENRQFWLAGYMWLKSLLQRGTYRTALEWAKLMLSLDRRDPYAMRQFIHVAAIKAEEPTWFLDFVDKDKDAAAAGDPSHVYMAQTAAVAHVQLDRLEEAKLSVRQGIAKVPWLYTALFQALRLDLPPSIWAAQPPGDHALWTGFYIHLAKDMWNNPACIGVLKGAAGAAPKPGPAVFEDPTAATVSLHMARVVYLEGSPPLLGAVPRHYLAMQPNFDFDPLPPPEGTNIFTTEASQLPWRYARANGPAGSSSGGDAGDDDADHAGVAPLEDDEGHHLLFRQYLAGEGRRLLREQAAEDGAGEEELLGGLGEVIDSTEEGQHEGGGGGDGDGDDGGPRYSRLEMIGLQAWILQQLAPWTAGQQGREGGVDGQDENGGMEGGDESGHVGGGEDEAESPRGVMPGSWPEDEH